jgi:hypothetical protein
MTFANILKTKLQGSKTGTSWEYKRTKRIQEALSRERGTEERPKKYLITVVAFWPLLSFIPKP